jgi:Fur family ferric uptake transcriptional regulator
MAPTSADTEPTTGKVQGDQAAHVEPTASGTTEATPRRQTRQRRAVDEVLAELAEFRTAQQIHEELRSRGGSVGLTTVYRRLQALADAGQLDAIRVADGETAYRHCSDGHHHHLVCRVCGRTVEVSGPAVEKWADAVAEQNGFREVSHDLEIFGTCQSC